MSAGVPRPGAEMGQVDQDAPFPPDASTASGLEAAERVRTPETGVQPATDAHSASPVWAWIEALAAEMEPEAFDDAVPAESGWREATRNRALGHAAKVWELGLRRVVVDDTTVERVAATLRDGFSGEVPGYGQTVEFWRGPARAAVRAVLGEPQ